MSKKRVALATCAALPGLDRESALLIPALEQRNIEAVSLVWSQPSEVHFDLIVVRSCWDYIDHRDAFLRWTRSVNNLANPAEALNWNTDKRYLEDLRAHGTPVVPTDWILPGASWQCPSKGRIVIKPAIGLAALNAGAYNCEDLNQRNAAITHVARLQRSDCVVMVQPYMDAIDRKGEVSLIYIAGAFSHAIRKCALLDGPDLGEDRRFKFLGGQTIFEHEPSAFESAAADAALRAVPAAFGRLLYARVDLIPDENGRPLVLEVELTEPNLYLHTPERVSRFTDAICAFAGRDRQQRGLPS